MARRRRLVLLVLFLLVAAGVGGWRAWDHFATGARLARGRAALDAGHRIAARDELDRYLQSRPDDPEAHFLAGKAARLDGDTTAAGRHLDRAAQLGWSAEAVGLELALLDVQLGRLAEAERVLVGLVLAGHPETPAIIAALVPAFVGEFRVPEAERLTARWVELRPESAAAWAARGDVLERLVRRDLAREAWREAVRLNPDDRTARLRVARLLVATKQPPAEAAGHLEYLRGAGPGDAESAVLLATCRVAQNRPDLALELLAPFPDDPKALHLRGRIELDRGRAAAAEPLLRRAADLDRSEPDVLYTHFLALQQLGKGDEVGAAEARWKRCVADLERVKELGQVVAERPRDPDPRREIGELFLRHGRDADGVRWLESALRVRPDHVPTHRILADYYDRVGQPDRAARHRPAGG